MGFIAGFVRQVQGSDSHAPPPSSQVRPPTRHIDSKNLLLTRTARGRTLLKTCEPERSRPVAPRPAPPCARQSAVADHPPSTDRFSDFTVFEQRLPAFSFAAAFSVGWRTLKRNYWLLVAASVAFMGINSLPALLKTWLENIWWEERVIVFVEGGQFTYSAGSLVDAAAYVFLTPAISAGFQYLGLGCVRWQAPGIGKLFAGFSRYWLLVKAQLILTLFWGLPLALVGAGLGLGYLLGLREDVVLGGMAVGALVTGLPALILLLWLGTRLAFTPLLIVDPMSNVSSAREAVRASWTVTRPIAWRLAAVLVLMQVGTAFCFILCCFPGFLLGLPLSCVVLPATYEMVRIAAMREESAE